jgi:hypothetical protein
MPTVTVSRLLSSFLARAEAQHQEAVARAESQFHEALGLVCHTYGVPDGAKFRLGPAEDGKTVLTWDDPQEESDG